MISKIRVGWCPCCEKRTVFASRGYWLRDGYKCIWCRSIPRQRTIVCTLDKINKKWKELTIHESSPSGPTFKKMKNECKNYSYSYFWENKELGEFVDEYGCTNQNLEKLTFEDESIDIFLTQDVMEHVYNPIDALNEIYRCLKPGGMHVFTVPIYPFLKTRFRVKQVNGEMIPIEEKVYHGNPIDGNGSLVTVDWGGDICDFIDSNTPFHTEVIEFQDSKDNHQMGLEADFLYVVVSRK